VNTAGGPLLTAAHLRKTYGTVQALTDASIELYAGQIHGLVGENGAGKSTLMRILAEIEPADEGTLTDHNDPTGSVPVRAVVPQYPRMAAGIPVWQNVLLGDEPRRGLFTRRGPFNRWGLFIDHRRGKEVLNHTVRRYGIDLNIDKRAGDLNGTEVRLAALIAALVRQPDILILDEPTVGLAETDREAILSSLESLRADGLAILYISHDLKEVCRIADRITVITNGRTAEALEGPVSSKYLAELMFGQPEIGRPESDVQWSPGEHGRSDADAGPFPDAAFHPDSGTDRGLRFVDTRIYDRMSDRSAGPFSCTAPAGSITAVTGIRESGLDLIERYLSGESRVIDGAVRVDGVRLPSHINPAELRKHGAVYIPSDRFDSAAALDGSVEENAILQVRNWVHPGGIRTSKNSQGVTKNLLGRFGVTASESVPLGALSGGTIQKLILARELEQPAPACIIAEPFAGLDLNSQKMLGDQLHRIAVGGTAVLVLSSSLESVVTVADRIFVLASGALTGPFLPHQTSEISRAFAGTWNPAAQDRGVQNSARQETSE
jgi:ABC-type sugar transport system ATPase subunit